MLSSASLLCLVLMILVSSCSSFSLSSSFIIPSPFSHKLYTKIYSTSPPSSISAPVIPPPDLPVFSSILSIPDKTARREALELVLAHYRRHPTDCGSSEVQIILTHFSIQSLLLHHFSINKNDRKDKHSKYGLIQQINRLKSLLAYYHTENPDGLISLCAYLGIKFRPKSRLSVYLSRYNNFNNKKSKVGQKLAEKRAEREKLAAKTA